MKTLLDYLSQNSTWRGLVLIAAVVLAWRNPAQAKEILSIGLAAVGTMLVAKPS